MARGMRTTSSELKMKVSKAEKAAREEAEAAIVTNQTNPKASPTLSKPERKIFNKLKKYNDNFTEADSMSLNLLSQYFHMWHRIKEAHDELDVTDDRTTDLERRMLAIDKQMNQHMSALCIPLSQRLRLANDVAKVMIEEKKLAAMESPKPQETNPLLAVLEATKHVK